MRRPDGLLNHNVLGEDKGPQDACGVFGVWAPGEEVAKLTFYGLYALQHRGTESAGIATSDGSRILVYKDMGLVSQVFTESDLATLPGDLAIGHCRYSTTGSSTWVNAQPTLRPTKYGTLALAHNGNLTNTGDLAELVQKLEPGNGRERGATTDTEIMTALISLQNEKNVEASAMSVLPQLEGAFSLVFMDEHTLYAARDRHGVRPLVLGKLENGWVVASESAALDIVGAAFVREIEPGEFVAIDATGVRSERWAPAEPKGCLFEYVYLARPDTTIAGQGIHATRVRIGERLAKEAPVEADLVIPVPESGTPAAIGYAKGSGIPFGMGLVKNSYVGRTFIQPSQTIRQLGIRLKLNPLREIIEGKRIVVVDDSIVRGNTQRAIVRMLREAGAREIHVRISSPPVKWPCFYGIDFATRAELVASGLEVEEIRRSIGADSLGYVSLEGLIESTQVDENKLCGACFTGQYPIRIPADMSEGKMRLEITEVHGH
ncbi:MAG: amidophosphoribosyltransferase [Actinobacteria bacterium]|jgi:amidophosphoribosyltransferase|nr:amidophosphoribosyltransferase [Actinomycetota bacterium]NCV42853.1 amidophosphoribosyltransferase [Actinomycetota bacterium]NCV82821.1 amidophosphoribosyltransferase [Actinomycetota bacterium]NCW92563.1 amidophosphoribosyltransferase [Actinomycetota bacterium]NCX16606.1 amidophosphoribosyltransferase [Actinomycetota bacterium]